MAKQTAAIEVSYNRERGEFPLVLAGKTYIGRLTTNSTAKVESISNGRTFYEIYLGLLRGSVDCCRLLVWAALYEAPPVEGSRQRRTHPEFTLDQIGDLIDESGGLDAITDQLKALVDVNARPTSGDGEADRPRPAAEDGTGAASTPTPLRSV